MVTTLGFVKLCCFSSYRLLGLLTATLQVLSSGVIGEVLHLGPGPRFFFSAGGRLGVGPRDIIITCQPTELALCAARSCSFCHRSIRPYTYILVNRAVLPSSGS